MASIEGNHRTRSADVPCLGLGRPCACLPPPTNPEPGNAAPLDLQLADGWNVIASHNVIEILRGMHT